MGVPAVGLADRFVTAQQRGSLPKPLSLSGCRSDPAKDSYLHSGS